MAPKLNFSKEEIELILNSDLILKKRKLIQLVKDDFHQIGTSIIYDSTSHYSDIFGKDFSRNIKITSGENLHGMPYVVLDLFSSFNAENILTLRVLFWWGNFISVNLLLSGKNFDFFQKKLIQKIKTSGNHQPIIYVTSDIWENQIRTSDPTINDISPDTFELYFQNKRLRFSKKIEIREMIQLELLIKNSITELISLIN